MRLKAILFFLSFYTLGYSQVYQGLVVPDRLGRWGNSSPITQSSGLAEDTNPQFIWTHNDQGNSTTILYKVLPAINDQAATIVKSVNILNTENLDWEDLAQDEAGNIYICQIGKNCNANSDPLECPTRFVFKIHKVSMASLNHPDSNDVTPTTYYFKYPLTGYDINNCDSDDTVFVNSEAAVFKDNGIYMFSKNIWSKNTNNCGGWIEGYTYCFRIELAEGSTMENPIVATYHDKFNLKKSSSDIAAKYQVTGADINSAGDNLALITYGRIWQFKDFEGDDFFSGIKINNDYSNNGSDTITRGYEGVTFVNDEDLILGVDGVNGRLSGIHSDSLRSWVRNNADDGPGSLRNAVAASGSGDTIRFEGGIHNSTIELLIPISTDRSMVISPNVGSQIRIHTASGTSLVCLPEGDLEVRNLTLSTDSGPDPVVVNYGNLVFRDVILERGQSGGYHLLNNGNFTTKGLVRFNFEP